MSFPTQAALPSGLWTGRYEQFQRNYPQQATLEFADGLIRGDGVDGIGVFHIKGEYRGGARGRFRRTHEQPIIADFSSVLRIP